MFIEKNKASERTGYLMVSDHHRPQPRAPPDELQVRCRPVRWIQMRFLKVRRSYRPGNTAANRPFLSSSVARGRKFLRNRTVVECHVSGGIKYNPRCGLYLTLWCTVRLELSFWGWIGPGSFHHIWKQPQRDASTKYTSLFRHWSTFYRERIARPK